ncbi:metallophosphoesterase family protein [Paenibacillus hexagrammi]|uniref:Calcineurin-like phosphoesterase domain-containing protein n=1 Tax=Paenibacillus hexagrammi TaxID=2908839 RepID=A0ABY3SK57_9BACL|nr:hypothetical protein [Paenibacillus sp. YPD9-1]UJF33624.1 hypothetical protein L0M14_29780 [Paenibacillus sp. YPD9-1]
MDTEQLEWLRAQLEASGDKPAFVFAHHPVHATTSRSTLDKLSIHPDIDMMAVLKAKKGPGFYFCGHNHANSIALQNGWHFIQTAACLDIPAFRVVELQNGQVSISLVELNDEELHEQISRFHTKMRGFTPFPEARGEAADWSLTVRLDETTAKMG